MIEISTRTRFFLVALLLLYAGARTWANEQEAQFTQIQGKVTLFTHPTKKVQKSSSEKPQALFEGEYFLVEPASLGRSVENGNIVRTAPGAKARLIYPNGDQINVGSATAYRIFWKPASQPNPQMNLAYGKIRAVLEKGGPRTGFKVKTRSAVMGVRGTDFFVSEASDGSTEVSTIRGEVELTPTPPKSDSKTDKTAKAQPPTVIKAGYSADVPPMESQIDLERTTASSALGKPKTEKAAPGPMVVSLRRTTQEELTSIQKTSHIEPSQQREPQGTTDAAEQTQKKIAALENQAARTTLNDIRTHESNLYASLANSKNMSLEQLNSASVQNILKDAPKAPAKRKPYPSEIDDLKDSAYDKYFKNLE